MASTNKTTNLQLSQYVGLDKPTYLGDYNSDMLKIDTGFGEIRGLANGASGGVEAIRTDLDSLTQTVGGHTAQIAEVSTTAATANSNALEAIKDVRTIEDALIEPPVIGNGKMGTLPGGLVFSEASSVQYRYSKELGLMNLGGDVIIYNKGSEEVTLPIGTVLWTTPLKPGSKRELWTGYVCITLNAVGTPKTVPLYIDIKANGDWVLRDPLVIPGPSSNWFIFPQGMLFTRDWGGDFS